jgi:hypothetical protein
MHQETKRIVKSLNREEKNNNLKKSNNSIDQNSIA